MGIDGVMNEMIKYGGEDLQQIKRLMKQVSLEEKIPEDWTKGLPHLQRRAPKQLLTRTNTVVSVLGKLYTSVLNERLTVFCERARTLVEEQAGFRKGRATVDQILIMHETY